MSIKGTLIIICNYCFLYWGLMNKTGTNMGCQARFSSHLIRRSQLLIHFLRNDVFVTT